MKKTTYQPLQETLYETELASGLRLVILPKTGFVRKAATLLIPFGSVDSTILIKDLPEPVIIPEGTAHFLEHMLFENGDNISRQFALLGASVNAYTTYNRTAVYFTTTNGIDEPLKLLFDMLVDTEFKQDSINKEKQIILKEITMYKDDVEQMMYYDLMNQMYAKNTIRNDIAGSEDSLEKIDQMVLMTAFDLFFQPGDMLLVLTGEIDIEKIVRMLGEHPFIQKAKPYTEKTSLKFLDPIEVNKVFSHKHLDLKSSLVMFGIKLDRTRLHDPEASAIQEIKYQLFLDNYLGKASPIQENMLQKKLINTTFDFSVSCEDSFAHVVLFTETTRPDQTIAFLKKLLDNSSSYQLDIDNFLKQKRKMIGDFVHIFDSVSRANALLSDYFLRGINVFQLIDKIALLCPEDLEQVKEEIAISSKAIVHYSE